VDLLQAPFSPPEGEKVEEGVNVARADSPAKMNARVSHWVHHTPIHLAKRRKFLFEQGTSNIIVKGGRHIHIMSKVTDAIGVSFFVPFGSSSKMSIRVPLRH
jgi:hypothetical protein